MDAAKKSTLSKRLLFGGLTIGLIVGIAYLDAFVLPVWPSVIVLCGLGLLAHWEIRAMLVLRLGAGEIRHLYGLGLASLALAVARVALHESGSYPLALLLIFPFVLLHVIVLMKRAPLEAKDLRLAAWTYLTLYLAIAIPALISIRKDPALGMLSGLLFLIAVAKIGDIAAYFVGSFAGKRKFAPLISPNKTWEGAIASAIAAIGLAAFLQSMDWAAGLRIEQALIAGIVINFAAQISDLSKSVLKRACGVKDSGSYFSVMGGALDMIDSLIFAAPAYVALRTLWA